MRRIVITISNLFILNIIPIVLFVVSFPLPLSAQGQREDHRYLDIGFSCGYAFVSMDEVNNDLKDNYNYMHELDIPAYWPDDMIGGFLFQGHLYFRASRIFYGLQLNYVSAPAKVFYSDYSGVMEVTYETKTVEYQAVGGYALPLSKYVGLFAQEAIGCGRANAQRYQHLEIYDYPLYTIKVKNDVNGWYFTSHTQGGIEFLPGNFRIGLSVGYRIADAGKLKGYYEANGLRRNDQYVKTVEGDDIGFDYSGLTFSLGVSFILDITPTEDYFGD